MELDAEEVSEKEVIQGNYYKKKEELKRQKRNLIQMKIMVLNLQTLNQDEKERKKKVIFIKNLIAEVNPEIYFLIDMGNEAEFWNVVNYVHYNDKRNVLGMRADIKDKVILDKGVFKIPSADLNFTYVRPAEADRDKLQEVEELLKKDYCVIGDINLRSNPSLKKICANKQIQGEDTEQTIIAKSILRATLTETFSAPSDHQGIIIYTKRRIVHTSGMRLVSLKQEEVQDVVKNLLYKGELDRNTKITQNKALKPINLESNIIEAIITSHLNGEVKRTYKYYEKLWKGNKKEPFLGTTIPEEVEDSLKSHYWHKDDKIYKRCEEKLQIHNLWPKNKSYSTAKNSELISLQDIDKSIHSLWPEIIEQGKEQEVVDNIIKALNNNIHNLAYTTFFLKKKKELKSVNDIRIISIVPTLLKVWESLIYDKIINLLSEKINSKVQYQFGGMRGMSTFDALFAVQEKYHNNHGQGILYIDLAKGYDTVQWDILEEDIRAIGESNERNMLKLWLMMVVDTDAECNERRIKKTRGLGMGLSLAPIVFEYYVHRALEKIGNDIEKLVMFVDDLAQILNGQNDVELFQKIQKEFKKRGLIVNENKCSIVTSMEKKQLFDQFKELGIEIKLLEKYLGVIIKMSEGNEIITDTRFSKISKDSICLNRAICFAIKVLIFEGALIARLRYSCMMISLKQKAERAYLFQNVWNFYRNDIKKLSYVQLATFTFNLFRMCIDLSVVREIQEAIDDQANIDDNLYSNWIKTKLITGIEVVDKVIDKCEFKMIKIEKVNMWYVKRICDELWNEYRRRSISCWMEEHRAKGVFVNENMDKIIDSKTYKNSIIIQEIIFRHLEYQDLKWIMFIKSILTQLVEYVDQESDILPNFKMIPLVKISSKKDDDEKLIQLLMVEYYKELDEIIGRLIEVEKDKDKKIKFKKIMETLLLMEDIRISSKWSKMEVEDWIYAVNVKIKIQEENISRFVSMVVKGTLDDDNEVFSNEQIDELNNVLVIDGSYNERENKIGAGFVIKNAYDINNNPVVQLEGKYYSTINEEQLLKQEAGEYKALVLGLACMKRANVKKVNVVYDFIGCERYTSGKWNTNIKVQKFVRAFHELSGGMTINFWKVKAHNGINLNEDANRLSRVGSGLEMPELDDRPMKEINFEGLMDFATQPNSFSNSCLII